VNSHSTTTGIAYKPCRVSYRRPYNVIHLSSYSCTQSPAWLNYKSLKQITFISDTRFHLLSLVIIKLAPSTIAVPRINESGVRNPYVARNDAAFNVLIS
jgi:hypothetical protein